MKTLTGLLYSTKATLWFLLIFAMAMAAATFIEDAYDTATAYRWIYGAKWFELVMLLLAVNFIGNIRRYNLWSQRKYAGFLFHFAFIVMILGAGVSRYIGYEGLMHIREGETSDVLVNETQVLKIMSLSNGEIYRTDMPVDIKQDESFSFTRNVPADKGEAEITCEKYIKNATTTIVENVAGGVDCMKMNLLENGKEFDVIIQSGEVQGNHTIPVSFNNPSNSGGLQFIEHDGKYFVQSSVELTSMTLPQMVAAMVPVGTETELMPATQYATTDGSMKFIFHGGYHKAKPEFVAGDANVQGPTALIVRVSYDGQSTEVPVILNTEGVAYMANAHVPGLDLLLGYGDREIRIPFSIRLNDFILDRYPGSSNPSSYASEVTVIDDRAESPFNYRIFMNHILDHDGFRFFQSSYDRDEKGTVLSVNHDFWGTWITYIGYFMLALGFILTLFSKHSRFRMLSRSIHELRRLRTSKSGIGILLLTTFAVSVQAQEKVSCVSKEHAEHFGQLVVQTIEGRFEPVHTLALDAMHKISRKDHLIIDGKGEINACQVMLDMIIDPQFWRKQPIIYIREKAVAEKVGIEGKYASFDQLVDASGAPKLKSYAEDAFRKRPQEQNTFDKEVIKVSERLDIFMMAAQGSLLRLFPEPVVGSTAWISWDKPEAQIVVPDNMNIASMMHIPQVNANNMMGAYLNAVYNAVRDGQYATADAYADLLIKYQRNSHTAAMLPSEDHVQLEIFYNNADIFIFLRNIYGLLAIVLLILAYLDNFLENKNRIVSFGLTLFLGLLGIAFLYHTFGMILRWYLSGHAPWSNGYEALLLVGWASILAGFSFIRYSKIPLAATALLAFFTLMTASHSSYDPQLTNLQPVLKSYWLVIHVATLTISYGFLGLAFVLGLFITSLFIIRNESNARRLTLQIRELSHINEMNVTIGLILATIGTFLGGVWANESWGRYWGWDAKETWALIITMVYSIVIHLRLVDKMRGDFLFTAGSVLAFSTVLMTFVGVNYYLSKGMHSYGAGDTPVFPIWAWIAIVSVVGLIIWAGINNRKFRQHENLQHTQPHE